MWEPIFDEHGSMTLVYRGGSGGVSDGTKVNVTDIVNTLTETATGKVLDGRQGKALKDLIDTLTSTVSGKETSGVAASLVNALKAGSTETIASLKSALDTLNSIVTGTTPDGDTVVNTIKEILDIFAAYPESVSLVTALSGKLDVTLYNSNRTTDQAAVAGKQDTTTYNANRTTDQAATALALTTANQTFLKVTAGPLGRPIVFTRANPGNQGDGLSNGTDTQATYRRKHTATSACSDIQFVYSNGGGETDGANPITIKASIEDSSGTRYPLTFNGLKSVVIDPGGIVLSDPFPFNFAKGEDIYSITYVSVSSGQKWYRNTASYSGTNEGVANTAADFTVSGGTFTNPSYTLTPILIVGRTTGYQPVIAGIGDSFFGYPTVNLGLMYAFGTNSAENYNTINLGQPGETAQIFATRVGSKNRMRLLASATSVIIEYGINDFRANRTTAQVQADLITIWSRLLQRGIATFQCTITPNTTSTDGWVTTANQTTINSSLNSNRIAFNDWLRDGAPVLSTTLAAQATGSSGVNVVRIGAVGHPLIGYFDTADGVESSRNSGLWKPGNTNDGLHNNSTGIVNYCAAITLSAFK